MSLLCDFCGKLYSHRSSLRRHILARHQAERFVCELCDISYRRREDLNRHVRLIHPCIQAMDTHTDQPAFISIESPYGEIFARWSPLTNQMETNQLATTYEGELSPASYTDMEPFLYETAAQTARNRNENSLTKILEEMDISTGITSPSPSPPPMETMMEVQRILDADSPPPWRLIPLDITLEDKSQLITTLRRLPTIEDRPLNIFWWYHINRVDNLHIPEGMELHNVQPASRHFHSSWIAQNVWNTRQRLTLVRQALYKFIHNER